MLWKISYRTAILSLKIAVVFVLAMFVFALWGLCNIPSDKENSGCIKTKLYHV
jgi:hypothetical protein